MTTPRQALEAHRTIGKPEDHWLWEGSTTEPDGAGYGQVEIVGPNGERIVWLAHRLAYYLETGELPEQVHHICEIKLCVNPACLIGLTLEDHQKVHHVKRVCVNGHSYEDPANVYIRPDGKGRQCRACNRERQAARR